MPSFIDEVNDESFIVMEYMDGVTLREWIRKKAEQSEGYRKLGMKEAIDLATQIAEGLEKAHEKGIIHRDVKSENIMVTTDGRAKIMDFGLAKMKRLDLKLFQKDVAKAIGVDTLTVCNWENNLTNPRLYLLPKIYHFLGHNLLQSNATTPGEKIKQYRIQKGLSLRKLARDWGIDPGTLAGWEKGESEPTGKLNGRLNSLLRVFAG